MAPKADKEIIWEAAGKIARREEQIAKLEAEIAALHAGSKLNVELTQADRENSNRDYLALHQENARLVAALRAYVAWEDSIDDERFSETERQALYTKAHELTSALALESSVFGRVDDHSPWQKAEETALGGGGVAEKA